MPSDERVVAALAALRSPIGLFRLGVSGTLERARAMLASESGPSQTRAALGEFAGGRIDPERFAMISSGSAPLDVTGREIVEHVVEVLEDLLTANEEQFFVDVGSAASPVEAIRTRLAELGTAYAAARRLDLVRRHSYDPVEHGSPSDGYPFGKWTGSDRMAAPPLVIRLDGGKLDAFELAPLIDGCVRLILIVDGPSAPAPLARLISPGVLVAQVEGVKVLEELTGFEGPAIIAVMQGSEARFVHDPRAGTVLWKRVRIDRMPAVPPRKTLGSRSAWQQRDDLAHLKTLIEPPSLTSGATEAFVAGARGVSSDPAERLTAWLIDQSSRDGVA